MPDGVGGQGVHQGHGVSALAFKATWEMRDIRRNETWRSEMVQVAKV